MKQIIYVGIAGAVGALCRYLCSIWLFAKITFPFATFTINIVGTFILCTITFRMIHSLEMRPILKKAITTGFLGSFTTFSAFSIETAAFIEQGKMLVAGSYVFLTVLGGLVASIVATAIAKRRATV